MAEACTALEERDLERRLPGRRELAELECRRESAYSSADYRNARMLPGGTHRGFKRLLSNLRPRDRDAPGCDERRQTCF